MAKKIRKKTKSELTSAKFRNRSKHQAAVLTLSHSFGEKLSKKRDQFIRDIASNDWEFRFKDLDDHAAYNRESRKWKKERASFLQEASKPLELHWFTCNWNAGRGLKPLSKIVKNPHCDAGTALRLYWINDPYYYQEYAAISDCPYEDEREMLRILRSIERRFKRCDFATSNISFDPTPWIDDKYLPFAIHQMPEVMREQVGRKRV